MATLPSFNTPARRLSYLHAGATLALAGIIDKQRMRYAYCTDLGGCPVCRADVRRQLTNWRVRQLRQSRYRRSALQQWASLVARGRVTDPMAAWAMTLPPMPPMPKALS